MAEVFLAQDTSVVGMERLVVIKRILPHLASQPRFISMFLDEARLTARLTHPNIAQLYEVGEDSGSHFVAIEFVHGADISTVLSKCVSEGARLSCGLVALICSRVADALHYAHGLTDLSGQALHIVHRDVSPQNIRISYRGHTKVIDFGIAKSAANVETTQTGVLKGKCAYMSPEQVDGKSIDGRSDIFALGVVMYEMLTHKRLFRRENTSATLQAILHEPLPPPSVIASEVPHALDRIVMRALERDPADRYAQAHDMQTELDQFLREEPSNRSDLEHFMTGLFGEPTVLRRRLASALVDGSFGGVFDTASSAPTGASAATITIHPESGLSSASPFGSGTTSSSPAPAGTPPLGQRPGPDAPRHDWTKSALVVALIAVLSGLGFIMLRSPGHIDRPGGCGPCS